MHMEIAYRVRRLGFLREGLSVLDGPSRIVVLTWRLYKLLPTASMGYNACRSDTLPKRQGRRRGFFIPLTGSTTCCHGEKEQQAW